MIFTKEERERLAELYQELEFIRSSRVYGGRGNGKLWIK